MENNSFRLKDIKNREGLNLELINKDDSVKVFIEKLNKNFTEILNSGGGPVGPVGPIGRDGKRGTAGPPGKDGDNIPDEFERNLSKGCSGNNIYIHDDVINNKYTGRSLLLSNIHKTEDGILQTTLIGDNKRCTPVISTNNSDYKLKVYNSSLDDNSKIAHFLNSNFALNTDGALCNSGYSIDLYESHRVENLIIKHNKNENITDHHGFITLSSDYLFLTKPTIEGYTQSWKLDCGDYVNLFELNTVVDELTAPQLQTIPNRTGYCAILEDVNEHSEIFENIHSDLLRFTKIKYTDVITNDNYQNTTLLKFDDKSYIKYKRLNNFVLVDFYLGVSLNEYIGNPINLNLLEIDMEMLTLKCKSQFQPFSVFDSEDIYSDCFMSYGNFKVIPNNTNDRFNLVLKTNDDLILNSQNKYWLSGQVWCTVIDSNECDTDTEVVQESSCPALSMEQS